MKYEIIVIIILILTITPLYYFIITSRFPRNIGYIGSISKALWQDFYWALLIQSLVIFATVIAILSLVRERIIR